MYFSLQVSSIQKPLIPTCVIFIIYSSHIFRPMDVTVFRELQASYTYRVYTANSRTFLGTFRKLRKATISFVVSSK